MATPITWTQQRINTFLEAVAATVLEAADAAPDAPDASTTRRIGGLSNPMSAAPRAQPRPERAAITQGDAVPAQADVIPAKADAIPAQEDAIPTQEDATPAQREATPA